MALDGLLIVDKPVGPTSHDVVARARRLLGERRIGHTGTLDPAASGVLPLVLGRATRLARFLSASAKTYEAVVRLGADTATGDAEGAPIGARYEGPLPRRSQIERALEAFQGTFLQRPPAYSAKKIAGVRSYKLARDSQTANFSSTGGGAPPPPRTDGDPRPRIFMSSGSDGRRRWLPQTAPAPVSVTARIAVMDLEEDALTLRIDCSAGFYVRALAIDLGAALGTGGHLAALRRTHVGGLSLLDAVPLDVLERDADRARRRVIPMSGMLPDVTAVTLTAEGLRRASHGRELVEAAHFVPALVGHPPLVRLLDEGGDLVGIAELSEPSGVLHPAVVLM